jgi:hypothetical protein
MYTMTPFPTIEGMIRYDPIRQENAHVGALLDPDSPGGLVSDVACISR